MYVKPLWHPPSTGAPRKGLHGRGDWHENQHPDAKITSELESKQRRPEPALLDNHLLKPKDRRP